MSNVISLPERLGVEQARIRESAAALHKELFYTAIGTAYLRVLSHHKDVTDPKDQYALALRMAITSLYAAANRIAKDPPLIIVDITG